MVIKYHIPDGMQGHDHPNPGRRFKGTTRKAYLPYTTEGHEVAMVKVVITAFNIYKLLTFQLLRTAFEAGLIFTVGTSHTTGQSDVVVWNDIHHKTSPASGP